MADLIPFSLSELPIPCYLVGGWVRDQILFNLDPKSKKKSRPKIDLDFVSPHLAVETARQIARKYNAGFVLLDSERQIARVVFANATIDFAQQIGDQIIEDLAKRDFCMNAIAIACQSLDQNLPLSQQLDQQLNSQLLIDPFGGQLDLQKRQVRMVAPENLQSDPLRILRAYRQAAQLNFELEPFTKAAAILFSSGLNRVAAERVTTELIYLLADPDGTKWITNAVSDRILSDWLPNDCLMLNRFSKIDQAIAVLKNYFPDLSDYFGTNLAGDRSIESITKLVALVDRIPERLELSKAEQRFGNTILRYLVQFKAQLIHTTAQDQYQLFQATGNSFPALVALAIAEGESQVQAFKWLQQWLDPTDLIAHPVNLVSGDQLKIALNLPASPKIGELLTAIRLAQVNGLISNQQEAIKYAASLVDLI